MWWHAVEASGRGEGKRATVHLIPMLSDPDAGVRALAAETLGRLKIHAARDALIALGGTRVATRLIPQLQDANVGVRWRAAYTLGRLRAKKSRPATHPRAG